MSGANGQKYFLIAVNRQVNGMLNQVRALRETALLYIAKSGASVKKAWNR